MLVLWNIVLFFFFFQAEDGIRDKLVTGVQTCALPIYAFRTKLDEARDKCFVDVGFWGGVVPGNTAELAPMLEAGVVGFKCFLRSEERRVGKECRSRGWPYQ